jgi:hypothetical protein
MLAFGGQAYASTGALVYVPFPVTMRTRPTSLEQSGTASDYHLFNAGTSALTLTSVPVFAGSTTNSMAMVDCTVSTGLIAGYATALRTNSANGYLGFSAEL